MTLVDADTGEVVATSSPEEARQRADRIKVAVEAAWHLVVEAYENRDWVALGYASWDDYQTREFGTARLRLPREERQEVVASLRDAGLSNRAIAAATGLSEPTVRRAKAGASNDAPTSLDRRQVEPNFKPSMKPVTGTDGKTYTPKPKPVESDEDRAQREEDERVRDTMRHWVDTVLMLDALMRPKGCPERILANWDPADRRVIDVHRDLYTGAGLRELAKDLLAFADRWEQTHG